MNSCVLLSVSGLTISMTKGEILGNIGLTVTSNSARILLKPGNTNGDALFLAVLNFPRCGIISKSVGFGNRSVAGLAATSEIRLNVKIDFRAPPTVEKVSIKSLLGVVSGRSIESSLGPEVGSLTGRLGFDSSFLGHSIGLKFSNKSMGHSSVLRLLTRVPSFAVFSSPSSNMSVSGISLLTSSVKALLSGSGPRHDEGEDNLLVARLNCVLGFIDTSGTRILVSKMVSYSKGPGSVLSSVEGGNFGKYISYTRYL